MSDFARAVAALRYYDAFNKATTGAALNTTAGLVNGSNNAVLLSIVGLVQGGVYSISAAANIPAGTTCVYGGTGQSVQMSNPASGGSGGQAVILQPYTPLI